PRRVGRRQGRRRRGPHGAPRRGLAGRFGQSGARWPWPVPGCRGLAGARPGRRCRTETPPGAMRPSRDALAVDHRTLLPRPPPASARGLGAVGRLVLQALQAALEEPDLFLKAKCLVLPPIALLDPPLVIGAQGLQEELQLLTKDEGLGLDRLRR